MRSNNYETKHLSYRNWWTYTCFNNDQGFQIMSTWFPLWEPQKPQESRTGDTKAKSISRYEKCQENFRYYRLELWVFYVTVCDKVKTSGIRYIKYRTCSQSQCYSWKTQMGKNFLINIHCPEKSWFLKTFLHYIYTRYV